jgi:hypothetical protein
MKDVYINRGLSTDAGTPGDLTTEGFSRKCLELPWRNNLRNRSCFLPGQYLTEWLWSNHFQRKLYHVTGVEGHDAIEIHPANWAGDVDLGLKCELRGCCAPGDHFDQLDGQFAILSSRNVTREFEELMGGEPFILRVAWKDGCEPQAAS